MSNEIEENNFPKEVKNLGGSEFFIDYVNGILHEECTRFFIYARDISEQYFTGEDVVKVLESELESELDSPIDRENIQVDWENMPDKIGDETIAIINKIEELINRENFAREWERTSGYRRIRISFLTHEFQKDDFDDNYRIITQFLFAINQIRNVGGIFGGVLEVDSLDEIVYDFSKSLKESKLFRLDVFFSDEGYIEQEEE